MTTYSFSLSITGPDGKTRRFPVPVGITSIGRQSGNDLHLEHSQISRQHARLECTLTECSIMDLGSSNGTHVNGEKLRPNLPTLLKGGDAIKVGPFEMEVEQTPVAAEKEVKPASTRTKMKPPAPEKAKAPPPQKPVPPKVKKPSPPKKKPPVAKTPPPAPPAPPSVPPPLPAPAEEPVPPGLSIYSQKLINYLPGIYYTDFMSRLLGMFEATLTPIEWTIDNFDLFLDPRSAPSGFLPWLANWFEAPFDSSWSEEQIRTLLKEAHQIYARRGTRWSLSRLLEIYTGRTPEIIDIDDDLEPFTFKVILPMKKKDANRTLIEALIDANKPAYTTYTLEFAPGRK